uniref:Uncharacterized protein n=1 Tax=Trichuris muris TaxID=70415 RepID=A0A5S6QF88_TRIMR
MLLQSVTRGGKRALRIATGLQLGKAMSTSAANLTSLAKPPNVILIDAIKETNKLEKLKLSIGACLDPDQYTIHHVSIDEFFTNPWKNKAVSVLLVNSESLTRDHWQEMYKFYRDGGIVVFFCSEVPQSLVSLDACVFFPASGEERQKLFASVDIASDQEDLKGWNQNAEAFVLSRHAIHPNPATFFYATENQRDGVVAFASFVHCTSGEHSIQYLRSLLSKVGLSLRSVTHLTPDYTPGRLFIDKVGLLFV